MSNILEIRLGGQLRTLRFNNWQKEALGKLYGTDPLQAGRKLEDRIAESTLLVICDLIYTGMVGNYRVQCKDIDFTINDIVEWVADDDVDNEEVSAVFATWLDSILQRNLLPGAAPAKKQADKKKPIKTPVKKTQLPGKKSKTSQ